MSFPSCRMIKCPHHILIRCRNSAGTKTGMIKSLCIIQVWHFLRKRIELSRNRKQYTTLAGYIVQTLICLRKGNLCKNIFTMSLSEICPILLISMSVSTTKGLPERNNHYKDYRFTILYNTNIGQ